MNKKYKILTFLILTCLINISCSSVKKAFDPERKNSSEEFLVEKKSPLSMPPNIEELPVPQNENANEKVESNEIKTLLNQIGLDNKEKVQKIDSDTENSLIEKIKNN